MSSLNGLTSTYANHDVTWRHDTDVGRAWSGSSPSRPIKASRQGPSGPVSIGGPNIRHNPEQLTKPRFSGLTKFKTKPVLNASRRFWQLTRRKSRIPIRSSTSIARNTREGNGRPLPHPSKGGIPNIQTKRVPKNSNRAYKGCPVSRTTTTYIVPTFPKNYVP